MKTRIYLVTDSADLSHRLVRASTPAQARTHVTRDRFAVAVAEPDELVELTKLGIEVENAAELGE